ncbi:MAG TPA: hypothetical protein VKU90_11830 [Caulobacteraceae bacterium]|nr:hypothetical protein [Caulobacteraceae bacterium]
MLQSYATIFLDAAIPQKLVFLACAAAVIVAAAMAARRLSRAPAPPPGFDFIADLRFAGPALGLLCAALNELHMMQSTLRAPAASTARMLAPGFAEMAALVEAGALVGMLAVLLHWALEARAGRAARR